jgi:hypothetical protein
MTRESDARRLLGVGADADADAVKAARRRLAKAVHPDVAGGSAEAMRALNAATDTVLGEIAAATTRARTATSGAEPDEQPGSRFRPRSGAQVASDVASFVIEALPAEAFEALLVVTAWIGEVIVDDPPYQLDVVLTDPLRCWCRLDLVPDAGASTVSLTIARLADAPGLPDIDDVRDLWVSSLNHLGAPE